MLIDGFVALTWWNTRPGSCSSVHARRICDRTSSKTATFRKRPFLSWISNDPAESSWLPWSPSRTLNRLDRRIVLKWSRQSSQVLYTMRHCHTTFVDEKVYRTYRQAQTLWFSLNRALNFLKFELFIGKLSFDEKISTALCLPLQFRLFVVALMCPVFPTIGQKNAYFSSCVRVSTEISLSSWLACATWEHFGDGRDGQGCT